MSYGNSSESRGIVVVKWGRGASESSPATPKGGIMKIDRVTVRYGELRSSGFPSFSNERHELELSAVLEQGETASEVKNVLTSICKNTVKREFGDKKLSENQMDIPF
jgi:hypothetical protein